MKIILENPYRILGLPANSGEKEIQKQLSTINRFLEIGKTIHFEYDFPVLGNISRSKELLISAVNSISSQSEKIKHALFWFVLNTNIDELAFSNLKSGNINKAIEIWQASIKENKINSRNFLSFHNLSIMYLVRSYSASTLKNIYYSNACALKTTLITSEYFEKFVQLVTIDGKNHNALEYLEYFSDELFHHEYEKNIKSDVKLSDILKMFYGFPETIKNTIKNKITLEPINILEQFISETSVSRNASSANGWKLGAELYEKSIYLMQQLNKILGELDVTYLMIANKLAQEILQCSIDYFNYYYNDIQNDPGEKALELAKKALEYGKNTSTKNRIEEHIELYTEFINNKLQRIRTNSIKNDITYIINRLETFQKLPSSTGNAQSLINTCVNRLENIKNKVGVNAKEYIDLCSWLSNNFIGMATDAISTYIKRLSKNPLGMEFILTEMRETLNTISIISTWNLDKEAKQRLVDTKTQIQNILQSASPTTQSNSSNCFIATAVYGSQYHPQVILLRNYRDSVLMKKCLGRVFVKIYYMVSPLIAIRLKNMPTTKKNIKNVLELIIRSIS